MRPPTIHVGGGLGVGGNEQEHLHPYPLDPHPSQLHLLRCRLP
jgi:hypothetical protein